ncbi:MAG: PhoU domain-containing protein [Candidatus Omnitrophica bacterium]|jgi:phosphate uptake regulator|nr:PhoU domain-containing protein [Candidatus Omnitrophota bacterium]MDD5080773.1 PhoU domain-containing protein [Candidatus Omnitrophota bacterium]
MFKSLKNFFKGKDFLTQVFEDFQNMLNSSQSMFNIVCGVLLRDEQHDSLKEKIYAIDKNINEKEKEIRKRVIEHLALQPSIDISTCLILMSVVKDAERLGDYCKNLYTITTMVEGKFNAKRYREIFNEADVEINEIYELAKKAFLESDESQAVSSWHYERKIAKLCDKIITTIAHSDWPVNEAVYFTLMARYYKRIVAHLTNISTSVILPVSELDYFDEDRENI